ncbi:beta-amyrin 11-oxidase-like [Carya illinoinensis]|uniref:beta-amyrin 11-oxidase-like n=1 Tax=Carya illinoinensis TaxID=32201 RepID=UPI001C72153E|nr:beta-amyrin 11-oxidase-like [Carya illinoinensis]
MGSSLFMAEIRSKNTSPNTFPSQKFATPECICVTVTIFEHIPKNMKGIVSMVINLLGFAFHKALQARKELVKVLQSVLNEKRVIMTKSNQPKAKKDMIDLLMKVEDEDGQKLEDEHVVDLLLTFLVAGFNGSAITTLWAMLHLTEHPEILEKAKEEQDEIIKRRPSTQKGLNLKEIKQMNYLAKINKDDLSPIDLSYIAHTTNLAILG